MGSRYWVGTDLNWHDANNWSLTSGGAGGAGIPTASDDVFFDGNGNVLCWPSSDIECNNISLLTGMTELFVIEADAVINGDVLIEDGYFGATGGPGYWIEFKGDFLYTGGTFSIGTGTGTDPTCEFSGTGKTFANNSLSAASFQNVMVSGELTVSGTRLSQMNIAQKLSITGKLTVNANGLTYCRVTLDGINAGFETFTGELAGKNGRLYWFYRSTHSMITGGTISIRYFRYALQDAGAVHIFNTRQYESNCNVEIEYTEDAQICRFEAGRHYLLGQLTIHCDVAPAGQETAELDWDTNTAEVWVGGKFDIYKSAFSAHVFTIKFGDGIHVFRHTVDFEFSYFSGTASELVVDPGQGTIILWPTGLRVRAVPLGKSL